MDNPFKAGDVVELKSGGPAMTVTSVATNVDSVNCAWFTEDESMARCGSFPAAALVAEPPAS